MPAHTVPYPAEVRITPTGHRRRQWRSRALLAVLGALAVGALVLNIVPGLRLSAPAPVAQHHAAARPKPPPVHITVGKAVYACTVVPPRKPARRH